MSVRHSQPDLCHSTHKCFHLYLILLVLPCFTSVHPLQLVHSSVAHLHLMCLVSSTGSPQPTYLFSSLTVLPYCFCWHSHLHSAASSASAPAPLAFCFAMCSVVHIVITFGLKGIQSFIVIGFQSQLDFLIFREAKKPKQD